ncbi:hypothetical protein ACFC0M_00325 [Streptomyces sp. NPDC056149]|uniref:Rv1733c family protein n=1 Tax=Streptomyces sp. NPDC056149 TaxID=3345728 RepID=UPI0035E13C5E
MSRKKLHRPWRPGPLRRGTDVAQSWLALATWVLITVGVPTAGVAAGHAVDAASRQQQAGWYRVSAVVTRDVPARIGLDTGAGPVGPAHTTVRWTAADRTVRTGETAVAPGAHVGDPTTVWLDRHGALVPDPTTSTDSLARSAVVGTVSAAGTGLLLLGAQRTGVHLLDRRRYAQWEEEWEALDARLRRHQQ